MLGQLFKGEARRFVDLLNWDTLVAPGVILCKDGKLLTASSRSAHDLDVVCTEPSVCAKQRETFDFALGDQHPVERIVVVKRQPGGRIRVPPANRQWLAAGVESDIEDVLGHVKLSYLPLDADLPNRCGGDVKDTGPDRVGLGFGQARIVQQRPKQDVGVKKQPHLVGDALLEEMLDLSVTLVDIVRDAEGALQGANEGAFRRSRDGSQTGNGAPIPCQLNSLAGLSAADELGELSFCFCDRNLHGGHLSKTDHNVGHNRPRFKR